MMTLLLLILVLVGVGVAVLLATADRPRRRIRRIVYYDEPRDRIDLRDREERPARRRIIER